MEIIKMFLGSFISAGFAIGVIRLIFDRIMETGIEKSLQTNWKRASQTLFDFIWTFLLYVFFLTVLIFIFNLESITKEAESLRKAEPNQLYSIFNIIILLITSWGMIFVFFRSLFKTSFEKRHYFYHKINDRQEKLIILKKVNEQGILCLIEQVDIEKYSKHVFVSQEMILGKIICQESTIEVKNRRYKSIYTQWNLVMQSKVSMVALSLSIIGILVLTTIIQQNKLAHFIILFILSLITYLFIRSNYSKGKDLISSNEVNPE